MFPVRRGTLPIHTTGMVVRLNSYGWHRRMYSPPMFSWSPSEISLLLRIVFSNVGFDLRHRICELSSVIRNTARSHGYFSPRERSVSDGDCQLASVADAAVAAIDRHVRGT